MAATNPSSGSTVPESRFSRYDLLLAAMPIPLVAGAVIASATALPTIGGIGIGSLVSGLFVCYSLFVATPTA